MPRQKITEEVALFHDADAPEEADVYTPDDIDDFAEELAVGDIATIACYARIPDRYVVRDGLGNTLMFETREGAEQIVDAIMGDSDQDEGTDQDEA